MSVRLPPPSLLSQITPQDWELTTRRDNVEVWRGRVLIEKWHEPLRDKLFEPQGGFRHILSCWDTNKIIAAVRHQGKIVSYVMLSQDGYYGTALPKVKTDVCLGRLGMWTHPDYRHQGFSRVALYGMFGVIRDLISLNQGQYHVVWSQAHVAHYIGQRARQVGLSGLDFEVLSFERLEEIPSVLTGPSMPVAI